MNLNKRTLVILTALLMASTLSVSAKAKKKKAPEEGATSQTVVTAQMVNLRPDDLTTMVAGRAETSGGVRGQNTVSGFNSLDVTIPVTINLAMTADVVADHPIFNPKCMAVMEEVRKAIRGK